ncbi:MAG: hypothetical protein HY996_06665 [Micrococcales bacterium]|nr:hypothetical protein [Micrococcales bacterium]
MSAPDDADPRLLDDLDRAREEIVPFIGERAEALYGWRLAGRPGPWRDRFAARLPGEDPERPQVTEAERLLLEWADGVVAGDAEPALKERMASVFSSALRSSLDRYALALRALAG